MRHEPILGGAGWFSVADWGSGVPYASGGHLLVCDQEDGRYPDAWHCPWADAGIRAAVKCIFRCSDSGCGHSQMGFWGLSGQYDWLSGPGHPSNFGGIYPGVSGKILSENYTPGCFHDCGSFLQPAIVRDGSAFYIGTHRLENRGGSVIGCICRNYRKL